MTIYEKMTQMFESEQSRLFDEYNNTIGKSMEGDKKFSNIYASLDALKKTMEKFKNKEIFNEDSASLSKNMYKAIKYLKEKFTKVSNERTGLSSQTEKEDNEIAQAFFYAIEAYDKAPLYIENYNDITKEIIDDEAEQENKQ